MKITFDDAISKDDLLHIALVDCLTPEILDSAMESREYEVKLVVNGFELDPKVLNLFHEKADEWIETRAKEMAAAKFHEAAREAEIFAKMVNDMKNSLIEKYNIDTADYE